MAATINEVVQDLSPILKVYKDGNVERLLDSPYVPPSLEDPTTGVSSKDITISPIISARLFIPKLTDSNQKHPILVYFHGGGFCIESAFSSLYHRYIHGFASQANALAISVEYRRAPEHPLPVAYEDSWAALQWIVSHTGGADKLVNIGNQEPWLTTHGDFDRIFLGGDSAGGNIVHNLLLRLGSEGLNNGMKILGGLLLYPYFWGSKLMGSESIEKHEQHRHILSRIWELVYPTAEGGSDNWRINPFGEGAPGLSGLGCSRLLVCAAENDLLRDRDVRYVEAVKESGWKGEVELLEIYGEDHCFDLFNPDCENAKDLMKRLASFIMQ